MKIQNNICRTVAMLAVIFGPCAALASSAPNPSSPPNIQFSSTTDAVNYGSSDTVVMTLTGSTADATFANTVHVGSSTPATATTINSANNLANAQPCTSYQSVKRMPTVVLPVSGYQLPKELVPRPRVIPTITTLIMKGYQQKAAMLFV